jgi:hypothetical protein
MSGSSTFCAPWRGSPLTTVLSTFLCCTASIQRTTAYRLLSLKVDQAIAEHSPDNTQESAHLDRVTALGDLEAWQELAQDDQNDTRSCPVSINDVQFGSESMEASVPVDQLLDLSMQYKMIDSASTFQWQWGTEVRQQRITKILQCPS